LKFLGMGVWGKALLSRRAFPQKRIFIGRGFPTALLMLRCGLQAMAVQRASK
jgi:hypothetical protein